MNKTYLARVPEADPAGSPIFKLVASDPDSGFNAAIRYSIVTGGDGVFQIDPFLGVYTKLVLWDVDVVYCALF